MVFGMEVELSSSSVARAGDFSAGCPPFELDSDVLHRIFSSFLIDAFVEGWSVQPALVLCRRFTAL